jgi:transcriptional antiterminator NusG
VARWYAVQVASSCEEGEGHPGAAGGHPGVDSRILEIEIPQTPAVKVKKDGSRQSTEEKVFPATCSCG